MMEPHGATKGYKCVYIYIYIVYNQYQFFEHLFSEGGPDFAGVKELRITQGGQIKRTCDTIVTTYGFGGS